MVEEELANNSAEKRIRLEFSLFLTTIPYLLRNTIIADPGTGETLYALSTKILTIFGWFSAIWIVILLVIGIFSRITGILNFLR